MAKEKNLNVIRDILEQIEIAPGTNPTRHIQTLHNLTREGVRLYFAYLTKNRYLRAKGYGKSRVYFPGIPFPEKLSVMKQVQTRKKLAENGEDDFYKQFVEPFIKEKNLSYALIGRIRHLTTELLNNIIDHSKAEKFTIVVTFYDEKIDLEISDNGVGVFQSIKEYFKLSDYFEAVGELTKGKRTTDSVNHAGEGIFFSSRMANSFSIRANGIVYLYKESNEEWTLEQDTKLRTGSTIEATFKINDSRSAKDVFNLYTRDFEFLIKSPRLVSPYLIKLPPGDFPSRSEAKKILAGAEDFRSLVFDFKDVQSIGQGFADEIFRVFQNKFPDTSIEVKNANIYVLKMIAYIQNKKF